MKLIHYSPKKINELEPKEYDQSEIKFQSKPNGLWFSVEGPDDWKEWCSSEKFCLERLRFSYEITLKSNSKILHLKTPEEIFAFSKQYAYRSRPRLSGYFNPEEDTHELNWVEIKKKYQGIIVSPYQWECRLDLSSSWYYGWDCASGCIWDIDCIESFTFIKEDLEAPDKPEKRESLENVIKDMFMNSCRCLIIEGIEDHQFEFCERNIQNALNYFKGKRKSLKRKEPCV
jgi:hypothetical protein